MHVGTLNHSIVRFKWFFYIWFVLNCKRELSNQKRASSLEVYLKRREEILAQKKPPEGGFDRRRRSRCVRKGLRATKSRTCCLPLPSALLTKYARPRTAQCSPETQESEHPSSYYHQGYTSFNFFFSINRSRLTLSQLVNHGVASNSMTNSAKSAFVGTEIVLPLPLSA